MRHGNAHRKLSRTTSHRKALLRNMATSLFKYDRIQTTLPKAKELKAVVDKIITTAKGGTLHARRLVAEVIQEKEVVKKIFKEIVVAVQDRTSGYTRLFKLGNRKGDAAPMALIELILPKKAEVKDKKKKSKKAKSDHASHDHKGHDHKHEDHGHGHEHAKQISTQKGAKGPAKRPARAIAKPSKSGEK
jgi:large subunit ribosomal protein L17